MTVNDPSVAKVFLHTGDCFLAVQPTLVTTVLGSCLAVTMHCPVRRIGVICHAFLPSCREVPARHRGDPQICRFVDTALGNMLQGLTRLRVSLQTLEVKIFGGAAGLADGLCERSAYNIGRRNVEAAQTILKSWGVTLRNQDVGGRVGRKIHFLTHTGEVWVKKLSGLDRTLVVEPSARYTVPG